MATLLTEVRLLGSETSRDSGAIWYVAATQAEHVLHARFFLLCGRLLIARVNPLGDYSSHYDSKSDGAVVGFEGRSQLESLVFKHDYSFKSAGLPYCSSCATRNMTCQTRNGPELVKCRCL
ncbi:hypothetical protein ACE103_10025 [Bradyrhizobium sp. ma5]|uniref:hypothetical protein n=1 Tax=Bradyrhizobium sp. ma5 TaxID=3344828 RepID=UPI0035D445B1